MKTNNLITFAISLLFMFFSSVKSQTLYNGVGHIPTYYQETWNVAGLWQDMSSVEPKLVIPISPGAASSQVTTAINTARNYVNTTSLKKPGNYNDGSYNINKQFAEMDILAFYVALLLL